MKYSHMGTAICKSTSDVLQILKEHEGWRLKLVHFQRVPYVVLTNRTEYVTATVKLSDALELITSVQLLYSYSRLQQPAGRFYRLNLQMFHEFRMQFALGLIPEGVSFFTLK